jgi:hypothetical protein
MQSPFPGMDPYIEAFDLWEDFHDDLIAAIKGVILDALPPGYVTRTRKRSYIALVEAQGKTEHTFVPDVKVTAPTPRKGTSSPRTDTAPVATALPGEPVDLRAFVEEEAAPGDGGGICASGRRCFWARRTWSRSTCCAAARVCRCSTLCRTAPITCSSLGKRRRRAAASGPPTSTALCHPSQCRCADPTRTSRWRCNR